MTVEQFQITLDKWLRANPDTLHTIVPEGSGMCRIANVMWNAYDANFLSQIPGRWTNARTGCRYFADDIRVCAAELGYFGAPSPVPGNRVVELWETTRPIAALSIFELPEPLKIALYEDRGDPAVKWVKSHALVARLRNSPEYEDVGVFLAPSASGIACDLGGTCLVAPPSPAIRLVRSLQYDQWRHLLQE
jgi:hypothetical protein